MQAMFELCHHFCLSGTTKVASQSAKTNAGKRTISIDSENIVPTAEFKRMVSLMSCIKKSTPIYTTFLFYLQTLLSIIITLIDYFSTITIISNKYTAKISFPISFSLRK